MKQPGAIVLVLVLVILLVLGLSRPRPGLSVDRCLQQAAACATMAWPDDRGRGRN